MASSVYRYFHGLPFHWIPWPIPTPQVKNASDALQATAGSLALVGAVFTGVYSYRKQVISEGESRRADAVEFSRRYSEALTQIGDDKAAVRLGGAYAMARLADDWEDQRQTCIDVLCAYLRMTYVADPIAADFVKGEDQVRNTIQRLIQTHVHRTASVSWSSHDFDLTGACLRNARFEGATFSGLAGFREVTFSGGASFNGTKFSGLATFDNTEIRGLAGFHKAKFSGEAGFNETTFSGGAMFAEAKFSGKAGFNGGTFCGDALFVNAAFSGKAGFYHSRFSGDALFAWATFSGVATFDNATFSGTARFNGTTFATPPSATGMTVTSNPNLNGVPFPHWPRPFTATTETVDTPPNPAPEAAQVPLPS